MAKEIRLKISKSRTINLKFGKPDLSVAGILNKIDIVIKLVTSILILGAFAWAYFTMDNSPVVMKIVYDLVIIMVGLQLMKRVFAKGDFFPTYSYDVQALIVVSLMALSLFVNIVVFRIQQNIWGLPNLVSFSGISIIALWFVYYLTAINFADKKGLLRYFALFCVAPVIGVLAYVFNNTANINNVADVMVLLIPGFFWLVISQKKLFIPAILNLVLACVMIAFASQAALISMLGSLFFIIALTVFINKSSIVEMKLNLDKSTEQLRNGKINVLKYIRENYQAHFLIIAIVVIIVAIIIYMVTSKQSNLSQLFITGGNAVVSSSNWRTVLFGRGLQAISGTSFFTVIYAFGILPILGYIGLLILTFKDLVQLIRKTSNGITNGKAYFFLSSLITVSIYSLIYIGNDTLTLLCWILFAGVAILVETKKNNRLLQQKQNVNDLSKIKDESIKEFVDFLQKFSIVIILISTGYLIYLISNLF